MKHSGRPALVVDCVLADAQAQHGRPFNSVVRGPRRMHPLIAEIKAALIDEPEAARPLEESFGSRMDYLRAKAKWIYQHHSRPGPPASERGLATLAARFDRPIPELVIDLYRVANGGIRFKPDFDFLSISQALAMNGAYATFDAEHYPVEVFARFLPLFHFDKVEVGVFTGGPVNPPVYAFDVWDTKVCYLSRSLENYLKFHVEANRQQLYRTRTTSHITTYSKREKVLAENIEGPGGIYPLRRKEGQTYFSLFRGPQWQSIAGSVSQ